MKKTETKNEETVVEKAERVDVRVPRGEDVYICVNGVGYLLPAMQVSSVPPEVAAEYYRSEAARDAFFARTAELAE